jgi:hypothetical protein
MERCRSAGISFDLERNNPAAEWTYRRLLIRDEEAVSARVS